MVVSECDSARLAWSSQSLIRILLGRVVVVAIKKSWMAILLSKFCGKEVYEDALTKNRQMTVDEKVMLIE